MYISQLSLVNYRNFRSAKFKLQSGINTIIGENGCGKTNALRAIRLILDDRMFGSLRNFDKTEFSRNLQDWRGHWLIIGVEFSELSSDEEFQILTLHATAQLGAATGSKGTYNLIFRPNDSMRKKMGELPDGDIEKFEALKDEITPDCYEIIFTGRSVADFTDSQTYNKIVGDFERVIFPSDINDPDIGVKLPSSLSIKKEVSLTYIQALRDVISEFRDSKTNPLSILLKSKSGGIDVDQFSPVAQMAKDLNQQIEQLSDVVQVSQEIKETMLSATGSIYSPEKISIRSDVPTESAELFQSLKLFVGEFENDHEGSIHELSLGGANLIFLALKLLDFKYRKGSAANFLLIEEPEAHIHTHIQKTLFRKLGSSETQIIYTTHSPQISEVCNISRINVIGKHGICSEVFQPSTGISDSECVKIERYLDAIRSNLLFAKSVILVEGDAEEIGIPALVKMVLGLTLDELAISLVNVRSTGFKNIANIFHADRIRKRCAIITDGDKAFSDTTENDTDAEPIKAYKKKCINSEASGRARRTILDNFTNGNQWTEVFYAEHTFEVDYCKAGNSRELRQLSKVVFSQKGKIDEVEANLSNIDIAVYGKQAIEMANYEGKGWFSILLSEIVSSDSIIPEYIINAILFALGPVNFDIATSVLKYRMECNIRKSTKIQESQSILAILPISPENVKSICASLATNFPCDVSSIIISKIQA